MRKNSIFSAGQKDHFNQQKLPMTNSRCISLLEQQEGRLISVIIAIKLSIMHAYLVNWPVD